MPNPKNSLKVLITVSGTTAVRLLTAVIAVDSEAPKTCKSINITNTWSTAAGTKLLLGDSGLSPTRWGEDLDVGQARFYPPAAGYNPPLGDIYLLCKDGGTASVGISIDGGL